MLVLKQGQGQRMKVLNNAICISSLYLRVFGSVSYIHTRARTQPPVFGISDHKIIKIFFGGINFL